MVRFVNRTTGGIMWVNESRVEEYKAAGHKLAAETPKPVRTKAAKQKTKQR